MMKQLLIIIILFITACSNTQEETEKLVIGIEQKKIEPMVEEISYLKKDPKDSIGLSLSGGGVRSATFNIGIMGGLYNGGVLQELDYISSVSGGSYAAYWYYTKLYWNQGEEENFFKMKELSRGDIEVEDNYRFQEHLEKNMKMERYPLDGSDSSLDVLKTTESITWRVFYTLPFALLDTLQISRITENNFSPMPDYFRNSIERIYGFYPDKGNEDTSIRKGTYINRGKKSWRIEKFGFEELKSLYHEEEKPPIWIINTTADVNNRWPRWTNSWKESPELYQAVFEFTPFSYGNKWYGNYETIKLDEGISHYVQTSGAALDSANHYNLKSAGILVSPFSMGNYVELEKESVYLTDGGHSENLGAYSLIKRGVGKIIISDAEYAVGERLTGLIRLINQLKDEYEFEFKDKAFNKYVNEARIYFQEEDSDLDMLRAPKVSLPKDLPLVLEGVVVEKKTGDKMNIYYIKLRSVKEEIKNKNVLKEDPLEDLFIEVGLPDTDDEFMEDATSNMWYTTSKYKAYFILGEYLGRMISEALELEEDKEG